jgi:nitronate monooxygenase
MLAERFGLSVPVIQAPMAGGGDTAALVAAVCNAEALGFVGAAYLTPEQILERGRDIRARTPRPFGINLFAPQPIPHVDDARASAAIERLRPYYEELGLPLPQWPPAPPPSFDDQLAACLECGAAIFSVAFGLVPRVAEIKRRGLFVMGTATTVAETKALAETGVDAVVAQGSEAGGHRSTFAVDFGVGMIGTMALVPQVVDAVSVPVIASGGIMDGRGIAAALALGATAVQMGTAFLTCDESGVPEAYKEAILGAAEDATRVTRAFSGRAARGIANRLLRDYEDAVAILPFPLQNALTRPLRTEAAKRGRAEFLSLWAGQGVRMARRTTAAELVQRLRDELAAALAVPPSS